MSDADRPPVVLLFTRFFQRVSERTVYASCLPTVWMSMPLVVISLSLCFSDPSVSSVRLKSFLSLVICGAMAKNNVSRPRALRHIA